MFSILQIIIFFNIYIKKADFVYFVRQKSSGAEGDRLKEAANINKSLSTLGYIHNRSASFMFDSLLVSLSHF